MSPASWPRPCLLSFESSSEAFRAQEISIWFGQVLSAVRVACDRRKHCFMNPSSTEAGFGWCILAVCAWMDNRRNNFGIDKGGTLDTWECSKYFNRMSAKLLKAQIFLSAAPLKYVLKIIEMFSDLKYVTKNQNSEVQLELCALELR